MTITALSTVLDTIYGPWQEHASFFDISDPQGAELFLHPLGTVRELVWGEGMQRAGRRMNAGLWAVLQHTRETYTLYCFEESDITDVRDLEDFARAANAIFLAEGRLLNGYGEDLLDPENQHSVPYHPDAWLRASRIRADLGVAGIRVLDDLPPVRSEHELFLRDPLEVARRVCALIAVSEIAAWWQHKELNLVEDIFARLPDARSGLTPAESELVAAVARGDRSDKTLDAALQLAWSAQAAVPLAHLLGAVELPAHLRGQSAPEVAHLAGWDMGEFIPVLAELGSAEFCRRYHQLAAPEDVADFHEYVRSLRWVAVDETLRPEDVPVIDGQTFSALLEWHKALAWLTNPTAEWDNVDLPT